jgi:hypothetical protein
VSNVLCSLSPTSWIKLLAIRVLNGKVACVASIPLVLPRRTMAESPIMEKTLPVADEFSTWFENIRALPPVWWRTWRARI